MTVQTKQQQKQPVIDQLPDFFQDKMETLSGISKLSPEFQRAIYRDAARVVQYCKHPIRLWQFQKLSVKEQMQHLPGLYDGYSIRSQRRMFNEAKMYMRYVIKAQPESVLRSFWDKLIHKRFGKRGK